MKASVVCLLPALSLSVMAVLCKVWTCNASLFMCSSKGRKSNTAFM